MTTDHPAAASPPARTRPPRTRVQTLVLCRYPLLCLLLLAVGPWLVVLQGSPLFANVFVLERFGNLALVTWLAFPPAWIAGLGLHLILHNQAERFGVEPPPRVVALVSSVGRAHALASLASLSLVAVTVHAWEGSTGGLVLGLLVGALMAAGLAALLWWMRQRIERMRQDPEHVPDVVLALLRRAFHRLGPGFVVPGATGTLASTRIAPGHLPALLVLGLVVGVTVLTGFRFDFARANHPHAPTLLMVELLFAFVASALPAASFFFDRWRVPLLVPLVPVLCAVSFVADTDARFDLEAGRIEPVAPAVPLERALAARPEAPLVLVCAAGGGIQAAAWTTAVLTGLERETEGAFSDALCLVSGASGGSVGLLHFLAAYRAGGLPAPAPAARFEDDPVYAGATTSSLFATAWGIVNGDFPRALVPPLARQDRGWAQERAWAWNVLGDEDQRPPDDPHEQPEYANDEAYAETLGELAARLEERALPALVFQSTVVESGMPLLITNVALEPAADLPRFERFDRLYPDHDVELVTAARLSATFPYVSPTPRARAADGTDVLPLHYGDGGYYENFGVTGAVAWLRSVRETLVGDDGRADRDVVVLLIDPFVPEPTDAGRDPVSAAGAAEEASTNGWINELWNPVAAALGARGPNQRAIGETLLQAWREDPAFAEEGARFHVVRLRPEAPVGAADDHAPPNTLSWHLTRADRELIWRVFAATLEAAHAHGDSVSAFDACELEPCFESAHELARLLALFE